MDQLQQNIDTLQALGLTLPSPAYIIGAILFGIVGMVAFYYGRKRKYVVLKWLGVALMLYPYVISETWLLYIVGAGLCAACYYYRNR